MSTTGILRLSREEYDDVPRVNWSALRHMLRSPAHYRQYMLTGRKDTDAMKRGRVVHLAVFEPERLRQDCVLWDGGVRRGKDWDAFKRKHAGREILTEDEHRECLAISEAVRADRTAAKYLQGGRSELSILWDSCGTGCKGRIDFESATGALVDLKTTRDASPGAFGRQAFNYGHCAQAAFYVDGYEAVTGKRPPYVLVAAETEPPYATQVYRVPEQCLELGRDVYRPLLELLGLCLKNNQWPGYADGEMDLQLPRWALPDEESGLAEELGLVAP